jgi:hypothetical protein
MRGRSASSKCKLFRRSGLTNSTLMRPAATSLSTCSRKDNLQRVLLHGVLKSHKQGRQPTCSASSRRCPDHSTAVGSCGARGRGWWEGAYAAGPGVECKAYGGHKHKPVLQGVGSAGLLTKGGMEAAWSCMSAMSGDTTRVKPGSTTAGSW